MMECSPSDVGKKPGERRPRAKRRAAPRDDGEGRFQGSRPAGMESGGQPGPSERLLPEDKTGHIPRVCERTFAQLCQFGVGAGSDKYINHKADARATPGENRMSYETDKDITVESGAGPGAVFQGPWSVLAQPEPPEEMRWRGKFKCRMQTGPSEQGKGGWEGGGGGGNRWGGAAIQYADICLEI